MMNYTEEQEEGLLRGQQQKRRQKKIRNNDADFLEKYMQYGYVKRV